MALNENAKKWVEALRSGKYEQGIGFLEDNNKFCCLGVACRLALSDGIGTRTENEDGDVRYGNESGVLPESVKRWLGLATVAGDFYREEGGSNDLTYLNDAGRSFSEIADLIESEPEGLFATATATPSNAEAK